MKGETAELNSEISPMKPGEEEEVGNGSENLENEDLDLPLAIDDLCSFFFKYFHAISTFNQWIKTH